MTDTKGINLAVVGATGNVGREIIAIVQERQLPYRQLYAVASAKSAGSTIPLESGGAAVVEDLASFDFSGVDVVLASAGGAVAAEFAPKAVQQGAVVIDNSSHFRMEQDVPLIVPEVNGDDVQRCARGIIANPNCSTIQMVVLLHHLLALSDIEHLSVATYQSVSGAGRAAMDELFEQTSAIYNNQPIERAHFTKQIAFNVIPHIDVFMEDGSTREEWKMVAETQKILARSISMMASCVRVPVFVGHGEAIHIVFRHEVDEDDVRRVLGNAANVAVVDHRVDEGYVTPLEAAGEDAIYVSRIRQNPHDRRMVALWCVADNLRKGAALNAVQIAEEWIKCHKRGR